MVTCGYGDMSFYRKGGGSNITPSIVKKQVGGVMVGVSTVKRRLAGAWQTVWSAYTPITAVVLSGNTDINGHGITTISATGNGSSASPTYLWSTVSGNYNIGLGSSLSSANMVIYSKRTNNSFTSDFGTYRCTVSDGTSSAYADVTVTFYGTL